MTDRPPALFNSQPAPALDKLPLPSPTSGSQPPFSSPRSRATVMLLLATAFWGLSFPLAKALVAAQRDLLPQADSWFFASQTLMVRFGLSAAVLALFSFRSLLSITRREFWQGIGLGVFASGGLILQLDGLNYTAASTSAFLTSCYCVIIPVIVAFQRRSLPPKMVIISCVLVAVGMGLLARFDWHTFRLGRGEWETLFSSLFFAGQILWLERPRFVRNRTSHATLIMFASLAFLSLPVMFLRMHTPGDIVTATVGSGAVVGFLAALTLLCTLLTFTVMNHWQRHLEATQAGLIYCVEPIYTSLFALFLPAWLSAWGGIAYANETATVELLAGGVLITAANVCIQLQPRAVTPIH